MQNALHADHPQSRTADFEQAPTQAKFRWRLVAVVCLYTALLKVLPYLLYRFGMDVERDFSIYPWNFSPIFAVCLFGGAVYASRAHALWIPLAVMLLGDLGIWAVTGKVEWAFYAGQPLIYAAFVLCVLIGFALRENRNWWKLQAAGGASCLSFFLITNFAVWWGSSTYPQSLSGLIACYVAALPFLKNSLVATALFGGLLFSPLCLLEPFTAAPEEQDATNAEPGLLV